MSTKTTLKRIALVAVSALSFGLLSALPSSAAIGGAGFSPIVASVAPTGSVTTRLDFTGAVNDVLTTAWTGTAAATTFSWRVLEVAEGVNVSAMSGTGTSAPVFTVNNTSSPLSTTKFALIRISTSSAVVGAGVLTLTATGSTGSVTADTFTLSVVAAGTASTAAAVVNGTDVPLRIQAGQSNVTASNVSNLNAITAASTVTASTNTLRLFALNDTVAKSGSGSYRAVQVTGSTIAAVTGKWVLDGAPGTATRAFAPLDGDLAEAAVNIASIAVASGVSTYTTSAVHNLTVGDYVNIASTTNVANAGLFVVATVPSGTTFTVANAAGVVQGAPAGTVTNHGQIWVAAATAGTVTVSFVDRSAVTATSVFLPSTGGQFVETTLQTITLTVSAPNALNAQQSTAYINAVHDGTSVATDYPSVALFGDCVPGGTVQLCDMEILAPAALAAVGTTTSAAGTAKAVIRVDLRDSLGNLLVGTLPAISAAVSGPGTISIGTAANDQASAGRSLAATAAPASTFYINVFSDGNSGTSTISISVAGSVWSTKTMKFYTTPVKVVATQGLKVLKAGTSDIGCSATDYTAALAATPAFVGTLLDYCDGSSVAQTVGVSIQTLDANGTPVPFRNFVETSSDSSVLVGNTTATIGTPDAAVDYLGTVWYELNTTVNAASGKTATMTYTTAPTATTTLSTPALTFAIGGAPSSASLSIAAAKNIGEKGSMTVTVKDVSGNAIFDSDHTAAFTSSVALASGAGLVSGIAALPVIGGTASFDFFNPLVAGTVNVTGLISGLLPIAGSFTVTNAAQDAIAAAVAEVAKLSAEAIAAANAATKAAQDEAAKIIADSKAKADAAAATAAANAAQAAKDLAAALATAEAAADAAAEAIDAANAATDAANLAAEAADAATVAAEEARDAADASTAAVEALATEVAALIASLKAQITTLANTVAKIAKKVKA